MRNAYDADGDGLIDVHTVEQLNVIRHDVNGDGEIDDTTSDDLFVDSSKASIYVAAFGYDLCPPDRVAYAGYELAAALDFAGSEWSLADGGEGWAPIGDGQSYLSTFEGNGHTITGLYINRPDTENVGLFRTLDGAIIRNVFLEEVSVLGRSNVGGLVGVNRGFITSSYATGDVIGNDSGKCRRLGGGSMIGGVPSRPVMPRARWMAMIM